MMPEQAVTVLLDKGLLGAITIILIGVVVFLYNQVQKKQTEKDELQEKRIAESREGIKAIEQNTNTMETLTEVLKATRNV